MLLILERRRRCERCMFRLNSSTALPVFIQTLQVHTTRARIDVITRRLFLAHARQGLLEPERVTIWLVLHVSARILCCLRWRGVFEQSAYDLAVFGCVPFGQTLAVSCPVWFVLVQHVVARRLPVDGVRRGTNMSARSVYMCR